MESPDQSASCHVKPTLSNEQFIAEHFFSYLVSGSIVFYDGNKDYAIQAGDYCFAQRNQLVRYLKKPSANGPFKTVSLFFDQDFLRSFGQEYGYTAKKTVSRQGIVKLRPDPLLENYIRSMEPYLEAREEHAEFIRLKKKEILLILLKLDPDLKNTLFDFKDPGKIDLKSFMDRNFRFNVSLERFAYLTGRSLTGFKRDFETIFNSPPGRWLQEKRLEEARYLIQQNQEKPVDVYLKVGFEDLSHFSYAFKKMYGQSPKQLKKSGR